VWILIFFRYTSRPTAATKRVAARPARRRRCRNPQDF